MERIPVFVHADDPISQVGVTGTLRERPEVLVLGPHEKDQAKVALVVSNAVDDQTLQVLRSLSRASKTRLVLIAARIEEADLLSVVEHGVVGLVRRIEATAERLIGVIRSAAAGEAAVPPDLLARLLSHIGRAQSQAPGPHGAVERLTLREIEVLRLVADGLDTAAIAAHLSYSQRTVKQVLHDVQSRFHLRNRSHSVAYALRNGLI
ncbi:response regulator transcription factor [Streptomyces bicolor]|uniref:response regulator transcription factor n=1 Tax=Streptomyces bicolor TaxID=66874 RepID=UPI0004E11D40|nr:response regulator transcription factor [Streptomyces bicolor]